MRRLRARFPLLLTFGLLTFSLPWGAVAADPQGFDEELFKGLKWREVGPYRGGRSAAVAGIVGQPNVYYFGATGGGVWKTMNGGTSWANISDKYFGGSIGAVAVSEWDNNVVYVGGGEKTVRGNVSHGGGVWKSTDAGKTWKHMGLADSRRIPRIRIHPKDPERVYVAALGHLFGPNEERGIFRSTDGGESWEKILYVSDEVGAVDLAMDPTNARILYACFWRVKRTPYSLESGGEGSGLWKSTDGGDSWEEITDRPGLPAAPLGIAGISVSRSNPENVYAIIEAEKGGVFRSRDAGETWTRTNEERSLRQRAWYYSRIYADPNDENSVYVLNVNFHHSKDGGRSFRQLSPPHGDNHDMWIDPEDSLRMIESNDGGANVSYDGGETWSAQDNQPTSQMYRVSTDNAFPYRLLGGQQDNSAVRIRSRSATGGSIGVRDWEPTAGGESGHIVAKPDDPDIVFGGSYGGTLVMVNHRTGERRSVDVWPDNPMGWGAGDLKFRFQWNFPLFFSPHDPNTLYAAANVLFKSTNLGQSWRQISPDLTVNDKSTQNASGGPITKDNTGVEYYATIFAALESPHEAGVFWAASDDGLIHVSRNGGETWDNVTPKGVAKWMMWNSVEAHPTEPGGLYVAGTRYKLDDFEPYLYKTSDYGKTWKKINSGIGESHFTRALRADPGRPGLLYAGTETGGVYVSFNDGASWQGLQLNLPPVPVTDLAVKQGDLVAATQGRGYWILDDLSPLHQWKDEMAGAEPHLFEPRETYRLPGGGRFFRGSRNAGTNPPGGVIFSYYLSQAVSDDPKTKIELEILDGDGQTIRTYSRKPAPGSEPGGEGGRRGRRGGRGGEEDLRQLESEPGLNRFAWNFSYPPAENFPGMILWAGGMNGPRAVPGTYTARLSVVRPATGDEGDGEAGETASTAEAPFTGETAFTIAADPRSSSSQEDLQAQFDFHLSIRDEVTRIHKEIKRVREVRGQIEGIEKRLKGHDGAEEVAEAAKAFMEKMKEAEEALYQTQNQSRQDPLNFPIRLNDKLAGVMGLASSGDFRPTDQMLAVRDELMAAIEVELEKLEALWSEDLPALNQVLKDQDVPGLILPLDKGEGKGDQPAE